MPPPKPVYEEWKEFTAPVEVSVVATAKIDEPHDPEAGLLALHGPARDLEGRSAVGELGPHHQRREADPDDRHRAEDRVPLLQRSDHPAEGPRQRERDQQDEEDLEQVRQGVGVLEGVGGVGVEVTAAVGAQLLDDLLGGDRAAVPLLRTAHELSDLVDAGEVLDRPAGDQDDRADHRDRDQDADGPAHQVGPEVAEFTRARPGEAAYECHRHGHADRGGQEVLHREAAGLHDVAHGLFAVVRLPVGVGDEGRGGVERLVRVDRGEAQRTGQRPLHPLHQVQEENAHRGEGEDSAQIGGPAHPGGRVGADGLVYPLLRAVVLLGGVDPGHVVAQRAVREGEGGDQGYELEQTSDLGTHLLTQNLSG